MNVPLPDDPARRNATCHVGHFLREVVGEIDAVFGEGFARSNPKLVASMVQASAIDAAVSAGQQAHSEALAAADRISREMGETILRLKPRLFG